MSLTIPDQNPCAISSTLQYLFMYLLDTSSLEIKILVGNHFDPVFILTLKVGHGRLWAIIALLMNPFAANSKNQTFCNDLKPPLIERHGHLYFKPFQGLDDKRYKEKGFVLA